MAAILDLPEMRARVRRWTVAEYEKLGDDPAFRRTELIRGLIVNKVSKSPLHSNAATRFYAYLIRTLRPEFATRQEQPLRLADSVPKPDLDHRLVALAPPPPSRRQNLSLATKKRTPPHPPFLIRNGRTRKICR